MTEVVLNWLAVPIVRASAILVASMVVGFLVEVIVGRALTKWVSATENTLDDKLAELLRRPLFLSCVFAGLYLAANSLGGHVPERAKRVTYGVIFTIPIVIWAGSLMRIGTLLLGAMSRRARLGSLIQPSSLPLFDIGLKVTIAVTGIYFVFLAWHMDLTAWVASAGVIGIALGFGARDSLANLFAGIFILADAPYKVGDLIVVEQGLRGRVTWIGIRSTRILTLDHIEITVPNGIIANGRIVNETGGPDPAQRIAVNVSVAYGSDIDRVREVLLSCSTVEQVLTTPAPEVRFTSFGDSGLNFQLLVWIAEPALRDPLLDRLNSRVYKAFAEAGIEIPYSKHDVYVKAMPS